MVLCNSYNVDLWHIRSSHSSNQWWVVRWVVFGCGNLIFNIRSFSVGNDMVKNEQEIK